MQTIALVGFFVGALIVGIVKAALAPIPPVANTIGAGLQLVADQIPHTVTVTINGIEQVFELIPTEFVVTGEGA